LRRNIIYHTPVKENIIQKPVSFSRYFQEIKTAPCGSNRRFECVEFLAMSPIRM
jgi:hypothetical protein